MHDPFASQPPRQTHRSALTDSNAKRAKVSDEVKTTDEVNAKRAKVSDEVKSSSSSGGDKFHTIKYKKMKSFIDLDP